MGNVYIRNNSRRDNRTNNRRIIGSICLSSDKEINTVKQKENYMITVEGALKDLEAIEAEATDAGAKSVVKALKVVVKFLSTIRSNQLLTDVDKVRIQKAKAERKPETKA